MVDKGRPPVDKRCDATKENVPRSRSASSADGMAARRTLAAVHRESANVRRLSSCWSRRVRLAAITIKVGILW